MSRNRERYLEEYEKYKHITIEPGMYILKHTGQRIYISEIEDNKAIVTNTITNFTRSRTLHWCRKNLLKE